MRGDHRRQRDQGCERAWNGATRPMIVKGTSSADQRRPRAPSIALLFIMLYAGQLGSTIYLPGLPDIARDLNTTLSAAQTMVATYLAAFAVAQLVMGPLSDRFGRRPVVVGGLVLFTVASVVCAVAPDIGSLLEQFLI